jgi:putative SOS response-associated peptidase YedK
MPVIVPPDARDRWLAAAADPRALAALLAPYPEEEMETYAVSRLVNSPKNDAPECVQPVDPPVARGAPTSDPET